MAIEKMLFNYDSYDRRFRKIVLHAGSRFLFMGPQIKFNFAMEESLLIQKNSVCNKIAYVEDPRALGDSKKDSELALINEAGFFFAQPVNELWDSSSNQDIIGWIPESAVTKIGGVLRRLLTHVYQAVTAPRKVAVACR